MAVVALTLLTGCTVASAAPTTTLAPLAAASTTTTTVVLDIAADVEGYVNRVGDGRTFDVQLPAGVRTYTLAHVTVPDMSTCEGTEARNLLASIVFGHKVRIDASGMVWMGDIDVASAMVSYGYAKASDAVYAAADVSSVDFDCSATTTTTTPVIVVVRPTAPRATRPRPAASQGTVAGVGGATDATVVDTAAPPAAEPTPVETPAPVETHPVETSPPAEPKTTPPATAHVETTPDGTTVRTPRTPATPRKPGP